MGLGLEIVTDDLEQPAVAIILALRFGSALYYCQVTLDPMLIRSLPGATVP